MKNIYQSVMDEANEKRRKLAEHDWQPAPELIEKVERYRREREARMAMEQFKGKLREF